MSYKREYGRNLRRVFWDITNTTELEISLTI
ncbi:hypothetical protein OXPF_13750 [Oxobacter pfennigii]|uniref:Uncharacterized protein n=1 Tax=Oxobacter pfennigii TaxID=36849 RepID=A0A0P9AHE9_9CLOT|nr:hypothetical protein OXPF_13750 [Oxobacter pfennigii]